MIQKNLPYILLALGAAIILYMHYNFNTGCCEHSHHSSHSHHGHHHDSSFVKTSADETLDESTDKHNHKHEHHEHKHEHHNIQ